MPTTSIDPVVAKNLKDPLKRIGRSAYSVAVALRRPTKLAVPDHQPQVQHIHCRAQRDGG